MTEVLAVYFREDGGVEMIIDGIKMTFEEGLLQFNLSWETPEDYEKFLESLPSVDDIPDAKEFEIPDAT